MDKTVRKSRKRIRKNEWQLLSMAGAGFIFLFVFSYVPMFGIILAFRDGDSALNVLKAITSAPWAGMHGFKNFYDFLTDERFWPIVLNTVCYNLLSLAVCMPIPVILALMFYEVRHPAYGKTVQFLTYLPHFVSMVVYVGIVHSLVDMQTGAVNGLIKALGLSETSINFKGNPKYSWGLMIISNILKGSGWGSIIYLAAIMGVDVQLFEAAEIDGANRLQKIRYITLPEIAPIFVLNLVLNISGILNNDAGTMLLWQTQSNLSRTEVFSTFILKSGINEMLYSYATAAGVFKSIIGMLLIIGANKLSKIIQGEGVVF